MKATVIFQEPWFSLLPDLLPEQRCMLVTLPEPRSFGRKEPRVCSVLGIMQQRCYGEIATKVYAIDSSGSAELPRTLVAAGNCPAVRVWPPFADQADAEAIAQTTLSLGDIFSHFDLELEEYSEDDKAENSEQSESAAVAPSALG